MNDHGTRTRSVATAGAILVLRGTLLRVEATGSGRPVFIFDPKDQAKRDAFSHGKTKLLKMRDRVRASGKDVEAEGLTK